MIEPRLRSWRRWIIAGVVVAVILCAVAFYRWFDLVEGASETAARSNGPIEISARDLAVAFDEDPVAADIEYDNRTLTVAGPYISMSFGPAGDPVISLGEDPVFDVTAIFDKADAPALAALRPGQPLRITCATVTAGPTGPSLADCRLLPDR